MNLSSELADANSNAEKVEILLKVIRNTKHNRILGILRLL